MEAEQIRILSLASVGVETYDKHSTWDDPYTNTRKKSYCLIVFCSNPVNQGPTIPNAYRRLPPFQVAGSAGKQVNSTD